MSSENGKGIQADKITNLSKVKIKTEIKTKTEKEKPITFWNST